MRTRRTDLACEAACVTETDIFNIEGTVYESEDLGICKFERLDILTEEAAEKLGKPCGKYVTVSTRPIQFIGEDELGSLAVLIGGEIRSMILDSCEADRVSPELSILVAGLGNSKITADAIGPEALELITVTRHIKGSELFDSLGMCTVSATVPGVLGKTGIESADMIKSAVEEVRPDVLIVIDALAAQSAERLAKTVQITDTGIQPGAGIGNRRSALNSLTLGIPVIAIGIPTVIDTVNIVYDAMDFIGIDVSKDLPKDMIEKIGNIFVTPKDADIIIAAAARLLSDSLHEAFVISET